MCGRQLVTYIGVRQRRFLGGRLQLLVGDDVAMDSYGLRPCQDCRGHHAPLNFSRIAVGGHHPGQLGLSSVGSGFCLPGSGAPPSPPGSGADPRLPGIHTVLVCVWHCRSGSAPATGQMPSAAIEVMAKYKHAWAAFALMVNSFRALTVMQI